MTNVDKGSIEKAKNVTLIPFLDIALLLYSQILNYVELSNVLKTYYFNLNLLRLTLAEGKKDHCNKTVDIYEDVSSPEVTPENFGKPLSCWYRFRSFRGTPKDWILRIKFNKFKVGSLLNASHCQGGYMQEPSPGSSGIKMTKRDSSIQRLLTAKRMETSITMNSKRDEWDCGICVKSYIEDVLCGYNAVTRTGKSDTQKRDNIRCKNNLLLKQSTGPTLPRLPVERAAKKPKDYCPSDKINATHKTNQMLKMAATSHII
ncbi:hypothetical protein FQA39_LY03667 [Lamprigera yunnana]|nr:hypothetical protein FQA39_LY03667 [Lamprigera yunnana]